MSTRMRVARIRAGAGEVPGFAAGLQQAQAPFGQRGQTIQTLIGDILKRRIADEQFVRTLAQNVWAQDLITKRDEMAQNRTHGRDMVNTATVTLQQNPALLTLYNHVKRSIPGFDDLPAEGRVAGFELVDWPRGTTEEQRVQLAHLIQIEGTGRVAMETGVPVPQFNVNLHNRYLVAARGRKRLPPRHLTPIERGFGAVGHVLGIR